LLYPAELRDQHVKDHSILRSIKLIPKPDKD